jgi:hypothetical protein
MADLQIPVVGETVEMMPGDVGVEVEEPGDMGSRQWLGRLAYRDVDGPASRIA